MRIKNGFIKAVVCLAFLINAKVVTAAGYDPEKVLGYTESLGCFLYIGQFNRFMCEGYVVSFEECDTNKKNCKKVDFYAVWDKKDYQLDDITPDAIKEFNKNNKLRNKNNKVGKVGFDPKGNLVFKDKFRCETGKKDILVSRLKRFIASIKMTQQYLSKKKKTP